MKFIALNIKSIRIVFVLVLILVNSNNLFAKAPGYAVATANPIASYVGIEILKNGGNAFDAAVAIAATLGVVEPYHSGLGGGGFWLLHKADSNENIFIDAREVAPMGAKAQMFLDNNGIIKEGLSINGGLAAAIPGQAAALAYIAKNYGKLPLTQTLSSAITLAEEGFKVDKEMQRFLTMPDRFKQLKNYPSTSAVFLKQGEVYQIGEIFKQKDLANTLKMLAINGHDGFYTGKIASLLVAGVNNAGGIWTLDDLKNYQIKLRKPLQGNFHGLKFVTASLPSAGGLSLYMMLKILAKYPLETFTDTQYIHYLVEAMRLSFWQRSLYFGDPDFVKVNVSKLLSPANIDYLNSLISTDKATPSDTLNDKKTVRDSSKHTTHFSILDKQGNRVAATLSINHIFGSSVVANGTGVLLNDEMDDFSVKPDSHNLFGLIGSKANSIEPGKRPLSNMTPTFLELDDNIAILGTPGGSRIPTMILIAVLKFQETFSAITMASTLRFHHQYIPDVLQFEPNAISKKTQESLRKLGYVLHGLEQYYGDMQVITWNKKSNLITATSDPRRIGQAIVIPDTNKQGYGFTY